jgi:hypothetical protein
MDLNGDQYSPVGLADGKTVGVWGCAVLLFEFLCAERGGEGGCLSINCESAALKMRNGDCRLRKTFGVPSSAVFRK